MIKTINDLIQLAETTGDLLEAILVYEEKHNQLTRSEMWEKMDQQLSVMEASVQTGLAGIDSTTGLTGQAGRLMNEYSQTNQPLSGALIASAVRNAVAVNEVNAAMGIICATPTAGSAGVVPGVLMALVEHYHLSRLAQLRFLFVAGIFGLITANQASISGAAGGCQAEIGSASAMASAAVVDYFGGSTAVCAEAFAMTLKNLLGLVCDPVAGLVEVPCIKRNALGASLAITMADMALAGVKSVIPADEVILAMAEIGENLDQKYKETAQGGLAKTKTALAIEKQLQHLRRKTE